MSQAPRDDNFQAVALGYDSVNEITEPLRVDPTTSRLLIEINYVASTTPAALSHKKDDNFIPVAYAVTDDADETLTPLIIDNRNGYLFIDLITE